MRKYLESAKASWLLAALVTLAMLPNAIWFCCHVGDPPWGSAVITPIVLMAILLAWCGKRLWVASLLITPFAALSPAEIFYIAMYWQPSSTEVLGSVFATNADEISGYFGLSIAFLALAVLCALFLGAITTQKCYRQELRWDGRIQRWLAIGAALLPVMIVVINTAFTPGPISSRLAQSSQLLLTLLDPIEQSYPFGLPTRIIDYEKDAIGLRKSAVELAKFRFGAQSQVSLNQRQIYVLVIGESSERQHWQLFGYPRPTNPELSRIDHLIPISNMVSSWPVTVFAVPGILTRKPLDDLSQHWKEPSLVQAIHEAGFDTWWISNQLAVGPSDSAVAIYTYEADHRVFVNRSDWIHPGNYDEDLLEPLRDALRSDVHRPLFIVLHMMGSHLPYDSRYTPTYKRFSPTIDSSNADAATRQQRYRNSYDNTILYTDHVLAQIILTLKAEHAISALWFVSDHGETLPTAICEFTGHNHGTKDEFMVPGLFWYSDAFAENFPLKIAQIQAHSAQPTLSASTFESVLDMTNVSFPGENSSWSLLSNHWRFHRRIVNGMQTLDFDNSALSKNCHMLLPLVPKAPTHA